MSNYLLSHTGAQIDAGIDAALNAGYRNKLINGSLRVWQTGTSFTITAGQSAWSADQVGVHNGTNQPVTVGLTRRFNLSGDYSPAMTLSFATAPTSGDVTIYPVIPDATTLGNGDVTLSYYCGTAENLAVTAEVVQDFGVGGSASVTTLLPGSFTPSSIISRYSSTAVLPSVVGKTFGTNNKLFPVMHLPIRTTNTVTLAMIQLERGKIATPFEMLSYEDELRRCLPFVQIIGTVIVYCFASSGDYGGSVTNFYFYPMHHAPSLSLTHIGGTGTYSITGDTGLQQGQLWFEATPAVGSHEEVKVILRAQL